MSAGWTEGADDRRRQRRDGTCTVESVVLLKKRGWSEWPTDRAAARTIVDIEQRNYGNYYDFIRL